MAALAPGEPWRVSSRSSWPCEAPDGLGRAVCVGQGEDGGEDSTEAVVLERQAGGRSEVPCMLHLECQPTGEMVSICVLSQARTMEVYVGEEYCGTGRGESLDASYTLGEAEKVTLYKKYLKFECPAASCRIKFSVYEVLNILYEKDDKLLRENPFTKQLLSIGEKQRVLIRKIVVQVQTVPAKPVMDLPPLGSGIDLDRVQTIMESMGSKLSPGAQQLMDMVRCQQKNSLPLGDRLNWIFGKTTDFGGGHAIDGLCGAAVRTPLDQLAGEPFPVKNHVTSKTENEDVQKSHQNMCVPERGSASAAERLTAQQNTAGLRDSVKAMGSLNMQEQASATPAVPDPQVLLPFLQSVCSQVTHLRLKGGDRPSGKSTATKEEGIQCDGVEQQPICSYLEKIISKNMDLMEKKLMDYIDCQLQALQAHIDDKMVLLMDLVQNSKPSRISQSHYGSNEALSNGER